MMTERENIDERLAREWLKRQGHADIQRPHDDPPDYVVGGRTAVEVRRLNRRIEINGQTEGEEQSEMALRKTIDQVLAKFGPPSAGKSWYVDCEYDFSDPLPKTRVTRSQIREALHPFSRPCVGSTIEQHLSKYPDCDKHAHESGFSPDLRLCLPCGICFELIAGSPQSATFILGDVSDGMGGYIVSDLVDNIQDYVEEKSLKVRKANRIDKYQEWWLLLIDHIWYISFSIFNESDLQAVRESVQDRDFWSRIVIISPENPDWSFEI